MNMAPADELANFSELRGKLAEAEAAIQRHQQQVQTGEERFRQLAEAAPFMIWMAGPDGRCTYVNRAWLTFRGRKLEEEIGNGWTEGLHPDDLDLCIETYLKSFSARSPFRTQYRVRRASGDFAWIEDAGTPHYDAQGVFVGYVGTAVDISERKHAVFTPDEEAVRMIFSLTERERQVLVLIAQGQSTKQAAMRLGISYKTADSHRSRILEKLGVHETASMVRYAIRGGLIAP
jgi:PAS domain S-box-containing protein